MQIILEVLQDPTDLVLQGACIGDTPMGTRPQSRTPWFVLGGEQPVSGMCDFPVPRAMIGWNPQYANPAEVGPMANQGGVVMVPIGPAVPDPLAMIVDPTQRFLLSALPLDATGTWNPGLVVLASNAEVPMPNVVWSNPAAFGSMELPMNPRREIKDSGSFKRLTAPTLPAAFGSHIMDIFVETTVRYTVSGITRNSVGAVLPGCRVVLLRSEKIAYNFDQYANPVVAEAVSDAVTGAYSIQVAYPGPYQVWSYLAGAPDVAGVTRTDVMAVANNA